MRKSPMSEKRGQIDWSLTTWEGSRRAQLRHALALTLRERMAKGTVQIRPSFFEPLPDELIDLFEGKGD